MAFVAGGAATRDAARGVLRCGLAPRRARGAAGVARTVCARTPPRARADGGDARGDDGGGGGGGVPDDDALRAQLERAVVARDFERVARLSEELRRRAEGAREAQPDASDETRVLQANERFYDALRRADAHQMGRVWMRSDSVCCALAMRPLVVGCDAVDSLWAQVFSRAAPLAVVVRDVRAVVRRNVAWVVCEQSVQYASSLSDIAGVRVATNVFQRRRGTWLLVHHHASPVITAD